MPDPPQTSSSYPPPPGEEDEPSPLSLRLQSNEQPAPPPPISPEERVALAQKRVGTSIKGWRLTSLLGTGPVSAAYEAMRGVKDAKERAVLKLMIGNLAHHERARSLFLRACYAANRFNHARVLPVMEDGTDPEGTPFVVRPWVEAESLRVLAERGDLDERQALRIGEQVLDALEMAHAHGILHGAITPENVLVTTRGSIRLCDFGTPPGLGATRAPEDEVLADQRLGPFTPPERCSDPPQPASEQGDVYSLAACLYFAMTKAAPRGDAATREELATRTPKPLRELAKAATEDFAKIVDHALAIDPLRRYESAYAMLGDVRRVMAGRKPKLADALAPVPSMSMADLAQIAPSSSRRVPSSASGRDALPRSSGPKSLTTQRARKRKETRGNFLLVFAIALLVGLATFVVVREKMDDARQHHDTAPSTSASAASSSR
jgi:serine/threonine protein kinase